MFKIVDTRTFTLVVPIMTPADGGYIKESLRATFQVIDTEAMEAFNLATAEGTTAFLKAAVVKLDGATNADNEPIAYNEQLRDQLLKLQFVRQALATAYFEAMTRVKEGN